MLISGGRIDLKDLNWEKKKYSVFTSYQQSKLANVLFTNELTRKLKGTIKQLFKTIIFTTF